MRRLLVLLPALASLALLVCTAPQLYGWQWPVAEGMVSATFGQLRHGGFSRGVVLGGGEAVYPASDGEIVFSFSAGEFAHPLGRYLVLQHESGFRTLYGNLDPATALSPSDTALAPADFVVDQSQRLASVGSSGFAAGRQTTFEIIDEQLDAFVNPLLILPERADRRSPVVGRIVIEHGSEQLEAAADTPVAAPVTVALVAEIYDPGAEASFLQILAPYEIVVVQDGDEVQRITYETLQGRDGNFLLGGLHAAGQLYRGDRMVYLGEVQIIDEPVSVSITVRDFSGNSVSKSIVLRPEF